MHCTSAPFLRRESTDSKIFLFEMAVDNHCTVLYSGIDY